jgi:protein SCO1/2
MTAQVLRWSVLVLLASLAAGTDPRAAQDRVPVGGPPELEDYNVSQLSVGGPFTLTDQDGKPFRVAQLRGKVVLMFLGYTFCPDVCPLSMSKLTRVKESLGAAGGKVQIVFITIDPERDTPARMKSYVDNFPGRAIGLTGTRSQVDQVGRLYRARFRKGEARSDTDYLMAHTAYLYVLDGKGKVRYMFPPDTEQALLATATRWLLAQ